MLFDPESRAKLEESLGLDGPSRFLGMGYLYPLPLRFDSGYLLRSSTDLRRYGEIYPFNSIRLFNLSSGSKDPLGFYGKCGILPFTPPYFELRYRVHPSSDLNYC
jgi:hypothetical protein